MSLLRPPVVSLPPRLLQEEPLLLLLLPPRLLLLLPLLLSRRALSSCAARPARPYAALARPVLSTRVGGPTPTLVGVRCWRRPRAALYKSRRGCRAALPGRAVSAASPSRPVSAAPRTSLSLSCRCRPLFGRTLPEPH